MTGARSASVLVLLAVPFGLYAAWQVRAAARGGSPPPADKLPTKDDVANRRARAEAWAAGVRKAAAVAVQFRAPDAADRTGDAECDALAAAAARRAADLADLETVLAGGRSPAFAGGLKKRYQDWTAETDALRAAAAGVEQWLGDREPVIGSPEAAEADLKRFEQKLAAYTKADSIFADRGLVAGWRVRAAARVVSALADTVKAPYGRVLELPLPLPPAGRNMDVTLVLGGLAELRAQAARLEALAARAKADGLALPPAAEAAKAAALRAAREWAAADELLALFAEPDLFTDPGKAGPWLAKVGGQYDRTQSDAGRELIRKKVQQFCAAYLPPAARLDAEVVLQGKREPRAGVSVEYDSDPKAKPLSDLPDELNEFNFPTRHKGFDRVVWANGSKFTGTPDALRPTPRSAAARAYSQARAGVTAWSAGATGELKRLCEDGVPALQREERRKHLDELVGAGGGTAWTKANTKIWTRLTALADAAAEHPALFGDKP